MTVGKLVWCDLYGDYAYVVKFLDILLVKCKHAGKYSLGRFPDDREITVHVDSLNVISKKEIQEQITDLKRETQQTIKWFKAISRNC